MAASTSAPPSAGGGSATSTSVPTSTVETTTPLSVATTPTVMAPSTTAAPAAVDACLDQLSLEEKVALLVWPAVDTDDWDTARAVVGELGVGGVLLLRPRLDEGALAQRIAGLDAASRLGVLVATDEEGGDVQRLVDIEPFPSQEEVSSTMTPAAAEGLVADHAAVVARVGVDVVLGPVVDVLPESGDPPLQRSRFFVGGPEDVAAYGGAYVRGWQSAELTPVLKHFPGHGSASADTHDASAVTPDLASLERRDLVPYRELVGTGAAVMIGHLTVPGLTDGLPATRSPAAVRYLRDTLGYGDALVISDALDMAASGGSIPDGAVASIAAGIDVVLFTATDQTGAVIDAVRSAVLDGRIPPERIDDAVRRVLAAIEQHGGGC